MKFLAVFKHSNSIYHQTNTKLTSSFVIYSSVLDTHRSNGGHTGELCGDREKSGLACEAVQQQFSLGSTLQTFNMQKPLNRLKVRNNEKVKYSHLKLVC